MIDTQLIMLEGLPSTGKSTNSYFLRMQLERNGKKVKWIHEVTRPHPTLDFSEAILRRSEYETILQKYPESATILNAIAMFRKNTIGFDLLEVEWNYARTLGNAVFENLKAYDSWNFTLDRYEETALEKWAYFSKAAALDKDTVYILDSSIFQAQIFVFLWNNAPYERLERFVHTLFDITKCLHPSLIYLYREDTEATIDYLEKDRGRQGLERIWERDKARPYYLDKPAGAEGFKHFLRDYATYANRLYASVACNKTIIEITKADWASYENQMLSFLAIENIASPNYMPPNGTYINEALNYNIIIDGLTMTDPDGNKKRLTPKNANEFYIECLPMILQFNNASQISMQGTQICARWSTTGTVYNLCTT